MFCLVSILLSRPYVAWVYGMYAVEVGLTSVLAVCVACFMTPCICCICPGIVQTCANIHIFLFRWTVLRTNGRGSNGLITFSGNCEFLHGEFWEENNRQSDTQTCILVQICRWYFRHLAHGQEKLREFLNNLNGLHNKMQFTMEKEGHLPFLDIDIYRKTDGSLGHKVYWKPTHTNLYLHHPANKQSVLVSQIHRVKTLFDQDSLTQELEFLTTVFKDNGYSHQQIQGAMKQATRTAKTNVKPTSTAYIPYTQTTYGRLSRMLTKQNIKALLYHLEKYSTTFHQSRMHWD